MQNYVNISAYRFATLADLKPLRSELLELCLQGQIKGTILLSTEGINLFVAGKRPEIEGLLGRLEQIPGLAHLNPKRSESEHQPFTRMLVRIKKEIIAFGVEGIDPSKRTSSKLPARELKRWLDEGRPFTLLDTRNDYEIKLGSFARAMPAGVSHFRDFPQAVAKLPVELKEQPIVMFCTGGIRCEKAGPYMEAQGFKNILQLEGGILKYFEECGNAHYEGDCFVFDQRVGVDPSLAESPNSQCFACLTPLSVDDQNDSRYQIGKSCPYCFKTSTERMREGIARRQGKLIEVTTPLPGSIPYENARPLKVPARFDGRTALETFSGILKHIPVDLWEKEFGEGRILGPDRVRIGTAERVRAGDRLYNVSAKVSEPDVATAVEILYEDEALIVVEKPAPLPVHPCGRYNKNTLQYFLNKVYAPHKPNPAHRLDANTSGVMLYSRTKHFAGLLQPQFAHGTVTKKYLARVIGTPEEDDFRCDLPLSERTLEVGARCSEAAGLEAHTVFHVLERFDDGTSLLEVSLLTGRTNQIRIHLWELGMPILGDQLYLPGRTFGKVQTGEVEDAPLCLHSAAIGFLHPLTKEPMHFQSRHPAWSVVSRAHDKRTSRPVFQDSEQSLGPIG